MAHATHPSVLSNAARAVGEVLGAIWDGMIRMGEARARVKQIEALYDLTDAELAKRGLRREDIVRHVLGDFF